MRAGVIIFTLATSLSWLVPIKVAAQCDSLLQAMTSDSGYVWASTRIDGDTTFVPPEQFSPYFTFSYEADSSYSEWSFSEFLINRRHVYLSNWCHSRVINYDSATDSPIQQWSPEELRNKSTTRVFPVIGNDTIQFFRRLSWIDRYTSGLSFSRYVNNNGIAYSVELVNSSNGSRICLLDSFLISTTTSSKKPCIYSWYPMGARVRSIVPSTLQDTTNAYIRINTWTNGANPYSFIRQDGMRKMMSAFHLNNSQFTAYSDSVEVNIHCDGGGGGSCALTVSSLSNPSSLLVSADNPSNLTNVEVRSIDGALVWSSALPLVSNPAQVSVSPGLLIVLGIANNVVICTKKVLVQ